MDRNVEVIEKLYQLAETQGTNNKKDFLKKHKEDEDFKTVLKFILDTQFSSGISDKKLNKKFTLLTDIIYNTIFELLNYLKENNTGKDSDILEVVSFAQSFNDDRIEKGIYNVVKQNWVGLGVDVKTVNSIYLNLIPTIDVMLAEKFEKCSSDYDNIEFICQEKLDGYRVLLVKDKNFVTLWSRNGKQKIGYTEIEKAMQDLPLDNIVFDGELQPLGFQDMDNTEAYKLTSNSTKKGGVTGMCMCVYDFMPLDCWNNKKCDITYEDRQRAYIHHLTEYNNPFLVPLDNLYRGNDINVIPQLVENAKNNNKEGIMVKKVDGLYEFGKRSKNIVKCKVFNDIDVVIEDWEYGTGRNELVCGALIFTYKGNKVKVGSGFSDSDRIDIAKNFDTKYKGKIMEVCYFEETKNKEGTYSLRFPTFKGLKELER